MELIFWLVIVVLSIFSLLAQYRLFRISDDLTETKDLLKASLSSIDTLLTRLAHDTRSAAKLTASEAARQKLLRGQTGSRERPCPGCGALLDVPTTGAHNCPQCGSAL